MVRNFAVTERWQFQIRGEFFNALNHTNLGTPNRFVNTTAVRNDHRCGYPGPRGSAERSAVVLGGGRRR